MILNILAFFTTLTHCIYGFFEDLINDISEKTTYIIFGCLYILIALPFKMLSLFFDYLTKFIKMNKDYVKYKKEFWVWYMKNKENN